MKICVLGFSKIKYMPYMNFYTDNIDCANNEVHLLYWNRDCSDDISVPENVTSHELKVFQEDEVSKCKKIISFIKYRKFALSLLKSCDFDLVICLHTLPGVLVKKYLLKHYKNKFIFDYRDYTYENIHFFKKIIYRLVNDSYATFVSSDAFRENLPKIDKIYTSHNILPDSLNHRSDKRRMGLPVRISFWGFIRHEDINREIIKKLANDERFELHYYGREQETALKLKGYAKEIEANNVFFHGEYKPDDRYEFEKKANIIHNLYDNDAMARAMANKYYDGIVFYLPQICNEGSFMGKMVNEKEIGLACNPYGDTFAEDVYNYYINLDWNRFNEKCDIELDRIMCEYNDGIKIITNMEKFNV